MCTDPTLPGAALAKVKVCYVYIDCSPKIGTVTNPTLQWLQGGKDKQ